MIRSAIALNESKSLKICRFGDNMRDVAVTEGDKVEAYLKFGWQIKYHGVGDLVATMDTITELEIDELYKDNKWIVEHRDFDIMVGSSSVDVDTVLYTLK